MSKRPTWLCAGCNGVGELPWDCPGCGKEICERCFDRLAHCKACAEGKTEQELARVGVEHGFPFDEEAWPTQEKPDAS